MSGNGAMTQEELDQWTADLFEHEHGGDAAGGNHATVIKPEPFWIAVFVILGIGLAGLVVWFLYYVLTNCVDDDLGAVTSEDIRLHYSNNKKSGGGGGLIDDTSGKCAICYQKKQTVDGKAWQTSGYGGCGYLVCNHCYVNYRPLAERCVACGQFYCYRRGRVTFSDLEKDNEQPVRSAAGMAAVRSRWGQEDTGEEWQGVGQDELEGLRQRLNSSI